MATTGAQAAALAPQPGLVTDALASRAGAAAAGSNAASGKVMDRVPVVCGDCKGVLLVKQGRVLYEGQEMSPTEFERLGGKASAKKWKNSVRVMLPDGSPGGTIGEWLQEHGVDIRNNQVFVAGEPAGFTQQRGGNAGAGGARLSHSASDSAIMRMARSDQMRMGLLPGDPTVGSLPREMPPLPPGMAGATATIDIGRYKVQELQTMAAATSPNPMGALLPQQPGVPSHRVAYVTGQEPKRRATPAERARWLTVIIETVHGKRAGPPWAALGINTPPLLAGMDLDLQRLYTVVAEMGGCHAVHVSGAWPQVAIAMGADVNRFPMAPAQAKLYYIKLLLAVEKYERARGQYPPAGVMGLGFEAEFEDFLGLHGPGGGAGMGPGAGVGNAAALQGWQLDSTQMLGSGGAGMHVNSAGLYPGGGAGGGAGGNLGAAGRARGMYGHGSASSGALAGLGGDVFHGDPFAPIGDAGGGMAVPMGGFADPDDPFACIDFDAPAPAAPLQPQQQGGMPSHMSPQQHSMSHMSVQQHSQLDGSVGNNAAGAAAMEGGMVSAFLSDAQGGGGAQFDPLLADDVNTGLSALGPAASGLGKRPSSADGLLGSGGGMPSGTGMDGAINPGVEEVGDGAKRARLEG